MINLLTTTKTSLIAKITKAVLINPEVINILCELWVDINLDLALILNHLWVFVWRTLVSPTSILALHNYTEHVTVKLLCHYISKLSYLEYIWIEDLW